MNAETNSNLRIDLDTKQCELSADEIQRFERGLAPLRKPVANFPVCDLHITVSRRPRSSTFHVKTALVLTGRTLVPAEVDRLIYPAFERCVRRLVQRVETYKSSLDSETKRQRQQEGTEYEIVPTQAPNPEAIEQAIQDQDYVDFRRETLVYEEPVRKRIGRWIERYPDLEDQLGERIQVADLVEEVFLNAFENFEKRPNELRFSEWLEHLIDPSVKALLEHPDEELENIQMARTLRAASGETDVN
jgi:ribosome-associated translation inhibitor RaiA